jgi:hypothetical protein
MNVPGHSALNNTADSLKKTEKNPLIYLRRLDGGWEHINAALRTELSGIWQRTGTECSYLANQLKPQKYEEYVVMN